MGFLLLRIAVDASSDPAVHPVLISRPRDCTDVYAGGNTTSGLYTVYIGLSFKPVTVYCDMDTACGGWTVCELLFICYLQKTCVISGEKKTTLEVPKVTQFRHSTSTRVVLFQEAPRRPVSHAQRLLSPFSGKL